MGRKTNDTTKYKTVAEAMSALGLTDQAVADDTGYSRSRITRLRGGEKIATLTLPARLCKRLGVPLESLADADAA